VNTCQNKRPLEGQRALVTGATTVIGAAVAEALAEAGAKVMINYLGERDKAERVAERIRAKQGQAMIFQTDVSEESQVKSMFDVLIGYWGSIDILVNNASLQNDAALVNMSLEQWNKVLSYNLTGQFLCTRETVREFLRRGVMLELSRSAGKIICITTQDVNVSSGSVNYVAARWRDLVNGIAGFGIVQRKDTGQRNFPWNHENSEQDQGMGNIEAEGRST
jgi:glucose 1-dehydrogenase